MTGFIVKGRFHEIPLVSPVHSCPDLNFICCVFLLISHSYSRHHYPYSTNSLILTFLLRFLFYPVLFSPVQSCSALFSSRPSPSRPILMTAGTAVSDMGDEPVAELRNGDQDEHATTTRRHSSSSATRQRRDSIPLTFLERLSLIKFARHTLGIFFLLVTVLLFTTSNFLSSVSPQPSDIPQRNVRH